MNVPRAATKIIGVFHDGVMSLQLPESFTSTLSYANYGRATVDLIRRTWVRFPLRSKYFFFASCGSLFPFPRANTQGVIHGFK